MYLDTWNLYPDFRAGIALSDWLWLEGEKWGFFVTTVPRPTLCAT